MSLTSSLVVCFVTALVLLGVVSVVALVRADRTDVPKVLEAIVSALVTMVSTMPSIARGAGGRPVERRDVVEPSAPEDHLRPDPRHDESQHPKKVDEVTP